MPSISPPFVLPGDILPTASLLPSSTTTTSRKPLRLGPGLRLIAPASIAPTAAGQLVANPRKNLISLERTTGRYIPSPNDRVIGTILRSSADTYHVLLTPHFPPALLPHLAFESATRKTRPVLPAGSLVYARISLSPSSSNTHADTELECVSAETGRADGLGPLGFAPGVGTGTTAGLVFDVSLGMARRLLFPRSAEDAGVVVLEELEKAGLAFELVVGRNGRVWVDAGGGGGEREKEKEKIKAERRAVATTVVVRRAIVETDERGLGVDEQTRLVRQLVAHM